VETCNVFYQDGQPYMLFTFNTNALLINPAPMEREKVYTVPMIKRSAASTIDKGTINDNVNTDD
ncbi:hypothetical protein, partial [Lactiplantibacillus pentosus]|uniref:hypothetical protein n=1 Tax=Lactiplantibacillus pentosus TaxID=1589 RepID=UPI0021A40E03